MNMSGELYWLYGYLLKLNGTVIDVRNNGNQFIVMVRIPRDAVFEHEVDVELFLEPHDMNVKESAFGRLKRRIKKVI